ncbi:MAG: hypothetical protein H6751_18850 [Candidatus Omnitrophica bacterium]|nr:hypothetical protein [Candidatus Omnitrophota bacterium]MCA9423699.1 hypothetical protein [Candidatus Omnitrophota bacterium]MCA9434728.1 hypothetical protein [Candidatus Omnitrophota bacterium]MCA9443012.1 hypothetical protein [Candidatus Omnitrophota bacterium]MCB9769283.1 hypothetical protein [Candidatus Omnitrophota bacterium]
MPKKKNRPWVWNFGLLLGSTLFALLLAELMARDLVSHEFLRIRYYRFATVLNLIPETSEFDEKLGFKIRPNLDYEFVNPDYDTHVRTNSMGFRDDEESLDSPRFLFLGDSFTFGWGVEEEEGFVSLFEKRSGEKSLNMGVPGYNIIQETRLLDMTYPRIQGEDQVVVLVLYDNDVYENSYPLYSPFPTIRKKGDEIIQRDPVEECFRIAQVQHIPSFKRNLRRWSLLADLAMLHLDPGEPAILPDGESPIDYDPETDGVAFTLTESFEPALRLLQSELEKHDLPLYAVYIPPVGGLAGERRPFADTFNETMDKLGIPHLDLTPFLTVEDYYFIDCHWRPSGQAKAADAIFDFLGNQGLLRPETN